MTEFKIGADPEFFLMDTETGKHVSAFNMIPGTKHDPFPVEGGAVQVDGMALEFNINAASSFKEFDDNITTVLRQLREMVPDRYAFDFVPVAHFGQEYIDAQPDAAKELGCDPDFSAWTGSINPKPDGSLGIRTASGHVHIGWTEGQDTTHPEHIEACQMMSKQLDYYLGVPSLMWDTDTVRRTMYGDWGCYRPKHYGVEYRTLSNAWVNDADLRKVVYYNSISAGQALMQGRQAYTGITPTYLDKKVKTNKKLINHLNDQLRMTDEVVMLLHRFYNDKMREAYTSFQNKLEREHYFYHLGSMELRHYRDLTRDEWNSGIWSHADYVMAQAKNDDMSYEAFVASISKAPEIVDVEGMKVKKSSDGTVWNLAYGVRPWVTSSSTNAKKRKSTIQSFNIEDLIIDDNF